MSRQLNSVSALFALTLMAFAATSAMAQIDRVKPNTDDTIVKVPTLECCRCLGGANTLDLSTISSNNWTVTYNNGTPNPVVFLTPIQINAAWNINPGTAKWVSTSASGNNSAAAGDYYYRLDFKVSKKCTIPQMVTLAGYYGGDDIITVYLDNTTQLVSKCAGTSGWCFNTSNAPPPIPGYPVGPGPHALLVKVYNGSFSPTGMFINAHLTGACAN